MHQLLINKIISAQWWQISDKERSIFTDWILSNYLRFLIRFRRNGKGDCRGGEGEKIKICCMQNAVIRFVLLGDGQSLYDQISNCYWSRANDIGREHCYGEFSFNLPVYTVYVANFYHEICAIQISSDINDFNSYRFFQYANTNIRPGNWQMPWKYGEIKLNITKPTKIYNCKHGSGNKIKSFKLKEEDFK